MSIRTYVAKRYDVEIEELDISNEDRNDVVSAIMSADDSACIFNNEKDTVEFDRDGVVRALEVLKGADLSDKSEEEKERHEEIIGIVEAILEKSDQSKGFIHLEYS